MQEYRLPEPPVKRVDEDQINSLPRDKIVGKKSTIFELETEILKLLHYNIESQNNHFQIAGLMENALLVNGPVGDGKSEVVRYATHLFYERASELGIEGHVLDMDHRSSYKDGDAQYVKTLLRKVNEDNSVFLLLHQPDLWGFSSNDCVRELNKFISTKSKGNWLYIGESSEHSRIASSLQSRYHVLSWQGADTPMLKTELFRYKLEPGIEKGIIEVDEQDLVRAGQAADEAGLNGAQITHICHDIIHYRDLDRFSWARRTASGIGGNHAPEEYLRDIPALPVKWEHFESCIKLYQKKQEREVQPNNLQDTDDITTNYR